MYRPLLFVCFLLLTCLQLVPPAACAPAETPLPVTISGTDPRIRLVGRFDRRDPRGPRCAWAASTVRLAFTGTDVNVLLRPSGQEDYLDVAIDGGPPTVLTVNRAQERYSIARGLTPTTHTIELFKRTEPCIGTIQLLGFELDARGRLLSPPPPAPRRIEIIGDSISCGFGNEAAGKDEPFIPRTENNHLAYGSLAARNLDADVACIAWSGRKMSPDNTIPEVYDRALPDDPASNWDFGTWIPHVVVINLATNDFRNGIPDRKSWTAAYRSFVHRVRSRYPQASIFCAIGPMMNDNWPKGQRQLSTVRMFVQDVVESVRADGDSLVHFLEFPEQTAEDGYGASWHPSLRTHARMARLLVEAIQRETGWAPLPAPDAQANRPTADVPASRPTADAPARRPAAIAPPTRQTADTPATDAPRALTETLNVPATVDCWSRLEITLAQTAPVDNPFDPDQARVKTVFTSPSGRKIEIDGFFHQDFERRLEGSAEKLTSHGAPYWRIRFTPTEAGPWQCLVTRTIAQSTETSPVQRFVARPATSPGFVRVGANRTHFAFDDGSPYFAIGENLCWSGSRNTYDYDDWFDRLAAVGCNYARLWIGPFDSFTLEHKRWHPADPAGVGRYDLAAAWRLDHVLAQAEARGIYLVLCTESFNSLRTHPEYPMWNDNPYNAANGGPLQKPQDFFTSPAARRHYANLLRYLVARYGCSPHVLAWEFWNEVDLVDGYDSATSAAWHTEMAAELRRLDPYRHLVTTSFANSDGDPAVDSLPGLDFVQTHNYGALDEAATLSRFCQRKSAKYGKPTYVGEFGVDTHVRGNTADPKGVHLHNGLWAPLFAQSAGTGMIWWWDSYVDASRLYPLFGSVARFAADIPWTSHHWSPLKVSAIERTDPPQALTASDSPGPPNLLVLAQGDPTYALVWAQNRDHTWYRCSQGRPVRPVKPARITVEGFAEGEYEVVWWDTEHGAPSATSRVTSVRGTLALVTPAIVTDAACKIRRLGP